MTAKTFELIKSLQLAVGALDATTMQPSELDAQLADIASIASSCKQDLRKTQAMLNSTSFNQEGFSLLESSIWCGTFNCQVMARCKPDGTRSYLLATDLGTGTSLPIAHFEHAPQTVDISNALVKAGMLNAPLGVGYEYAFNLDGNNDTSNFSTAALRDCAVDEAIIALLADSSAVLAEHQIITFEIYADGKQCEEEFPDIEQWIVDRDIPASGMDANTGERARDRS